MIECKYKQNGYCILASKIAEKNVIPHESACYICSTKSLPNQDINRTVVSIAISSLNDKNEKEKLNSILAEYKDILNYNTDTKLKNILKGDGVGSKLWNLLETLGIKHSGHCSCLDWAERMNLWGPELCKLNRDQIIEHMKKSAKSYGWGDISVAVIKAIKTGIAFKLSILDPYGSLLDEAIRLTKETGNLEKKN